MIQFQSDKGVDMYDDSTDLYNHLVELLWETNKTKQEIADELQIPLSELQNRMKLLGLDWVQKSTKKISRGHFALTQIMKKLIPGEDIINEHHIGERLMLDVYCAKYKLAAEFHGRQHFKFIPFFHPTYEDFIRGQERDERKLQLCKEQGISLVVFRYCDNLTEDLIFARLLEALQDTENVSVRPKKVKVCMKQSPQYEQWTLKRKAYERDLRKKIKQSRKDREAQKQAFYAYEEDEEDLE